MKFAIPAVVLLALLALLAIGLTHDPREIPSPLVGKPAPAFDLPMLGSSERVTPASLRGRRVLVNFFASWCAGCQVEHPLLLRLAQEQGIEIVGMDYKDTDEAATQWLQRHGNPYRLLVADRAGTAGLDWGVYGVPETYVLDENGTILFKQVGPVTPEAWTERIAPLLQAGAKS